MYFLYVDASGNPERYGSQHIVLGGAALFEGVWRQIGENLRDLIASYFPDPARRPGEIHCSELRSGTGIPTQSRG